VQSKGVMPAGPV